MKIPVFLIIVFFIPFLYVNADHLGGEISAPILYDDNYEIEKIVEGLNSPTTMSFLNNDIIILEHLTGKVILVKDNGVKILEPILDFNISYGPDYGLLGVETIDNKIFFYFVESIKDQPGVTKNTKDVLYQFTVHGENFVEPKLIKELDGSHYRHHSGALAVDNEKNLYIVKGDGDKNGILQNFPNGEYFESGIFKINTENFSSELIAMGIRNSFGLAIDPFTNKLWQTENAHLTYDEINLIENGFNGGWKSIVGPSYRFDAAKIPNQVEDVYNNPYSNFTYQDPKFSWYDTVGPTAIAFPNLVSFKNFEDSLFAADCNFGKIYKFQLNSERNGFVFNDPNLSKDFVLDLNDSSDEIVFADFPGCISDIEFRSDGMYVVEYIEGVIYRIYPKNLPTTTEQYSLGSSNDEIFCQAGFFKSLNKSGYVECVPLELVFSGTTHGINLEENIKLNIRNQNLEQFEFKNLDLSNSNFQNTKLSSKILYVNFTRTNLSHTDLSNKDLTGTILTGADLSNTILTNVDLSNKDLAGTSFSNVDLSNTDLTGTILTGADLSNTILTNVDLSNKDLAGAFLTNVDLSNTDLTGTILTGADLSNTILTNVDLSNKDLAGTSFSNVDLSNTDLTGTILTGADLSNTILTNVDLSNKDLSGAFLTNVDLSNKDLTGTILTGADLSGAILTNVDLSNKDLAGTSFSKTEYKGYVAVNGADLSNTILTNVDLSNKDLSGVILTNVDLSNKDLTGTILTGADLSGAFLTNVDLSNTDLTGTILTGADLSGAKFDSNNENEAITNEFEEIIHNIYDELLPYYHIFITHFNGLINRLFS